ncbi:MAG: hypothetical protein IIB04_00575 [Acidobacteria bacterium]|nr:hypothetical protein [Acidobacteriota bacterium]
MTQPLDQSVDADRRKPLILWIVPLVASVFVPALWWTGADWPFAFRPDLVATMTTFVAFYATVILAALSHGFRHRIRWAMGVTTVVVVVSFQWSAFVGTAENFSAVTGVSFLADVIPVAIAGSLIWISVRLAHDWQFAIIGGTATIAALVGVALASLSLVAPSPSPREIATAMPGSPDVLLLVLDGYGRADWLEDNFDFDNGAFLAELESRGFAIATEATANYSYTFGSVSSMLNLDYVFSLGEVTEDERKEMRAALTGAVGLIPAFKEAGYEVAYIENVWGGSRCGSAVDWCIRTGLARHGLWNLGRMSILAPLMTTLVPDPLTSLALEQVQSLGEVVTEPHPNDSPRFTFAHVVLPRAPMLFSAGCARHSYGEARRWGVGSEELQAERQSNYVDQVKCVNRQVVEALDSFLGEHPDGIVMITADHGPASNLLTNLAADELAPATIDERMKILSAYRLPGCEEAFRRDLTPVNGVRILLNCATGAGLGELPDSNRWMVLGGKGVVTDLSWLFND